MPESEQPRFHFGIVPLALAPLAGFLLLTSFSDRVRKLIRQRDKACQWDIDEGEIHEGILEAAHINHNRSYPQYNSPENGRLYCTKHHLADHESGRMNGLNEHQNNFAVDAIGKRLKLFRNEP